MVNNTFQPVRRKLTTGLLSTLIIILFFAAGYFLYQNHLSKQLTVPTEEQIKPATPYPKPSGDIKTKSYTETTTSANQLKYISPNLGISFLYPSVYGGEEMAIKEVENKIYIYPSAQNYSSGQYVEVFHKNPDATLVEAIKSTFLESYLSEKCLAKESALNADYPPNYIQANIVVPGEFTDMDDMIIKWQQCPQPYTQSNGISYFLMDKNHPDKFLFFSIGQYAIEADLDKKLTWEKTVEFLY